jgi:hypothetical protein
MNMKTTKIYPLVFNADGMVAVRNGELVFHEEQGLDLDVASVRKCVSGIFDQDVFVGDMLYEDVAEHGWTLAFMTFLEDADKLADSFTWTSLSDMDDDFAKKLNMHLLQTLYNANNMRVGYCYENTGTGEAVCVIHAIDDRVKNKKFLVVESTMCAEPMVVPADAYWGVPMKWVSHARFVQIVSTPPQTLVERSKHFFISAHNAINQRYDGKPYSFHLMQVNEEFHRYKHLIPEEDWERVEAELWGHDALEDTNLTYNDIKSELGPDIAEGAYSMTNEKGRNRAQRASRFYYTGLRRDQYGEFKKLCDRLANVRNSVGSGHSMSKAYQKEYKKFKDMLNKHGETYAAMWQDLENLLGI